MMSNAMKTLIKFIPILVLSVALWWGLMTTLNSCL
jgi:hypothetical protein